MCYTSLTSWAYLLELRAQGLEPLLRSAPWRQGLRRVEASTPWRRALCGGGGGAVQDVCAKALQWARALELRLQEPVGVGRRP